MAPPKGRRHHSRPRNHAHSQNTTGCPRNGWDYIHIKQVSWVTFVAVLYLCYTLLGQYCSSLSCPLYLTQTLVISHCWKSLIIDLLTFQTLERMLFLICVSESVTILLLQPFRSFSRKLKDLCAVHCLDYFTCIYLLACLSPSQPLLPPTLILNYSTDILHWS